jgi:hypothetical protein
MLFAADNGPYVEFDCDPVPRQGKWELKIKVSTEKLVYEYQVATTNGDDPESLADSFAKGARGKGFKVEVIDKVKVRVYGATTDGKFHPATKGGVESPDLEKNALPTVKVVGPKG